MTWIGITAVAVVIANILFFGGLYVWMIIDEWMENRRKHK